jgi:hypothetical protein
MGEAEAAARSHAWRNLLSHLSAAGETARLFDLLEKKPFLADQVEGLRGFQASGDDLENHALPAAIAARDWQRFLHYAAVALNFRGLAEDLAAPEILRALARAGRIDLALDAAGRLPDSFGQAQALAAVASGCEDGTTREKVLRLLEGRLDDLALEAGATTGYAETLTALAREVGPDLSDRWNGSTGSLPARPLRSGEPSPKDGCNGAIPTSRGCGRHWRRSGILLRFWPSPPPGWVR